MVPTTKDGRRADVKGPVTQYKCAFSLYCQILWSAEHLFKRHDASPRNPGVVPENGAKKRREVGILGSRSYPGLKKRATARRQRKKKRLISESLDPEKNEEGKSYPKDENQALLALVIDQDRLYDPLSYECCRMI